MPMPLPRPSTRSTLRARIPSAEPRRAQHLKDRPTARARSRPPKDREASARILDALIMRFNHQHTARQKSVSHKTRQERARFLRQFFRDLRARAGFSTAPDPRNLGQRHIRAMVDLWRRDALAASTIQTYLSFLRGLALWLDKPGFVRAPAYYGLEPRQYERHEVASRDRSWSAQGIDPAQVLARLQAYDARIAASVALMHAFGLRRKESVMFRPLLHIQPFEATGLAGPQHEADEYLWTKGKGGRVRWIPLQSAEQRAAVARARSLATSRDAHMGDPALDLRRNLRRLDYAMEKFGITRRVSGVTAHGLRHQHLNDLYAQRTGAPSPVRGGTDVPAQVDREARLAVAERAGHARLRAAGAYIGGRRHRPPVA